MAANAATGVNLSELTEHRGVRECLQWFTREKQWINEIHLQLCRVPAPTFLEQERAAWFLEQFRALGWDASIDRAGNVIARSLGDGPVRGAHRAPGYGASRRATRTISRWMPTAAFAARASPITAPAWPRCWPWRAPGRSAPPARASRCGLLLVANVGEEGEGNLLGMRHLCKQSPLARKIEAFVVVDGANTDHITNRAPGQPALRSRVHRPGRP